MNLSTNTNQITTQTITLQDNPLIRTEVNFRPGAGDAVVFVHGLGCSKDAYSDAFESALLNNYALLTIDLPGFGNSTISEHDSFELTAQADRLFRAINEICPDKSLHMVAHSMGGPIGLFAAEKLSHRMASYICVEGNLVGTDCGMSRRAAMRPYERVQSLLSAIIMAEKMSKRPTSKRLIPMLEKSTPHGYYHTSKSLVEWSDSGKLLDRFLRLSFPRVYFVGGENSASEVLKQIPDDWKVEIPNSGHFMMFENPHLFYPALASFLEKV